MVSPERARRLVCLAVAVLAVLFGGGRPLFAQVGALLGRPVESVRLTVDGRESRESAVLELVETRIGGPLTMVEVRQSVDHLFSLGRYEDIQVQGRPIGDEVALLYDLRSIRVVDDMQFRGRPGVAAGVLRAAITARYGERPPATRAPDIAALVEEIHRERGYPFASVDVAEEAARGNTLVFDVDAGLPTVVADATVEGADTAPRIFLQRIQVEIGRPYRPVEVEAALDEFRRGLLAQGFYEADVTLEVRLSEDQLSATLRIVVNRGLRVRLRFEGDAVPGDPNVLVPLVREQSTDEDLLEDSKRRIEAALQADGYLDGVANYRREPTDGTLEVVFAIDRGPRYVLAGVTIEGSAIEARLRGLLRLEPGEPFVEATLAADVAGMVELYRRDGFVDATIDRSVSTMATDAGAAVMVTLRVQEGERAFIGQMSFQGADALTEAERRAATGLEAGQPFYEPATNMAADQLVVEYLNRGYPDVVVQRELSPRADEPSVDVTFLVLEGPQVIVDHILIVGNTRTRSEVIERELVLERGEPLSEAARLESQRRVSALGLFSRVQITELRHPGEDTRRDILVRVEETRATTYGLGGGLEVGRRLVRSAAGFGPAEDRFELAPRAFFEVGRRNLWGRNRSVNLFSRVSFRRRNPTATAPGPIVDDRPRFNEYRLLVSYREPRLFGLAGDAVWSTFVEQGVRSSFNFTRRGTSVEMARRLTGRSSLIGRYSLDRTRLFDAQLDPSEQAAVDRLFPQVRLSSLSASIVRDTSDDRLDPTTGTFVTADTLVAARSLGSEVGFVRTLLKGSLYRRPFRGRRIVFAGSATVGLAEAFARTVELQGGPAETVDEIPASERFYAGGDTTVRGFTLDRLGTPDTIDENGFPQGGDALLIFNAELRVPVWGDLDAAGFIDVGNVFRRVGDVSLADLRGGAGFGIRYRSPLGPIRVDLGFKLSRLDEPAREPLTVLHISVGQAF